MARPDDDDKVSFYEEASATWKMIREHYVPAKHGPTFPVRNPGTGRTFEFKISKLPGDRYIVLCEGKTMEAGIIKNGGFG